MEALTGGCGASRSLEQEVTLLRQRACGEGEQWAVEKQAHRDSEGEYLMAAGTEGDIWDAEPRVILTVVEKMGREDSVGKRACVGCELEARTPWSVLVQDRCEGCWG